MASPEPAVKVVKETLETGDPALRFKAVVKILEMMGCDRLPRADLIDPRDVALATMQPEAERREKSNLAIALCKLFRGEPPPSRDQAFP